MHCKTQYTHIQTIHIKQRDDFDLFSKALPSFMSQQLHTIMSHCKLRTRALPSYLRATSDLTRPSAVTLQPQKLCPQ